MELRLESPDQPDVLALIDALDAYQKPLYPEESHHGIDLDALLDPAVAFVVARIDGVAVGCGGVLVRDGEAELKRMFVNPEVRGAGIGKALITRLEAEAVGRGATVIRLETGIHQHAAIALYERSGYVRRGPFGDYTEDPMSVFMEKPLPRRVLVVLDDDPTGTQSVAGLPVLTEWTVDDLRWALRTGAPAVYVLTNARSVSEQDAVRINREVVAAALAAAGGEGVSLQFVSRGDSTLRGHFPAEPDAIRAALEEAGDLATYAILLVPAFPDAGRVTLGGVHGVLQDGLFTPVAETEYARDAAFGFRSSRLSDWVQEKSGGRIPADHVSSLALDLVRSGPAGIAAMLEVAPADGVVTVDIEDEEDLRALAAGLDLAEAAGRRFVYRVGPPFVRARIGQHPPDPVEIAPPASRDGGLIVVGSHVSTTTRQLEHLLQHRPGIRVVEVQVPRLLDPSARDVAVAEAVDAVAAALADGDVVLHSSREVVVAGRPDDDLAIARTVSQALVEVVRTALDRRPPRFVIAKGGITSSDIARFGLGIRRAMVRGPLFPGIVSVWDPVDGPAVGIPYVVFAGNVGTETSLTEAVGRFSPLA